MNNNLDNEKQIVNHYFEELLDTCKKDQNILVSHSGELSKNIISNLEESVETKVTQLPISKAPIKKIFFISVETLQNMLLHGQKNHQGIQHNLFILSKTESLANLTSANLVLNDSIPQLQQQIDTINAFDDDKDLKAYYLEHLENNSMSDKGGAGLGFITIGMKSGNKLKVKFEKINEDYSLFILTSSVSLN